MSDGGYDSVPGQAVVYGDGSEGRSAADREVKMLTGW